MGAKPSPDAAVTIMGKYRLGRLLGRGSFAKVYEATSLDDGADVAIKIIDKTRPITLTMEPQIMREVAAMKKLRSHPNVLKIHEVMATKTKIFLVMDLADGGDLFSKLRRRGGRLQEISARRHFRQLVSALRYCHENGVAHRDLKPQNLLLDRSGALLVSDFGLSALLPQQLRSDGMLHTACGTPGFVAPEVFCHKGYDGAKADAWSCGVILYLLLSGNLPFNEPNLAATIDKMKRRDLIFPDWISKHGRYVIHHLLDPNPNSRMSMKSLMDTCWYKRSPVVSSSPNPKPESESDTDSVSSMNAFDIISMSSGLDLSGFFEDPKRGKRFTSTASFESISEKMSEVGGKLGFSITKGKNGSIWLGKGMLTLTVVVSEIVVPLLLVEVNVVCSNGRDFEELPWGGFREGLQDIMQSWHDME